MAKWNEARHIPFYGYVFMINRIIRLFYLSRRLMVKNIKGFFELKLRTCQEHFMAYFSKS